MTIDLLGFGNTDNAVTVRPANTITRGTVDTYAQDCSSPDADDGTAWPAQMFNDQLAQFRTALRAAGITLDNGDDMLWRAMNATGVRYGEDTGSANSIVVAFSPAPLLAHTVGKLCLVKLANDITGATDITPDGLAAKNLKWPDGTALAAGDGIAGSLLLIAYDGVQYQLLCRMNGAGASSSPTFVPGTMHMWPAETVPTGALECNGAAVSRTTYARLFDIIGTAWGAGNGTTTFNLPDMRGRVPRGYAHGSGNDPDRATRTASNTGGATGDHVGTVQADKVGAISGSFDISSGDTVLKPTGSGATIAPGPDDSYQHYAASPISGTGTVSLGSGETRGKNASVMYVIAF